MNYYEKNMEFLKEKDPDFAEKLAEFKCEKTEKVAIVDGKFGYPVVIYEKDGKSYQLSSPYDGEGTCEDKWIEQFSDWDIDGYLLCFGMARLSFNVRFREEFPEYLQFIYEPSFAVFKAIMEYMDLSFLKEEDILVVGGINDDMWRSSVYALTNSETILATKYLCVPNYERLFSEEYKEYGESLKKISESRMMDTGVWVRFSKELTRNLRDNIKELLRGYDLYSLIEDFPEGKPGILVSAGPSLNNNIDELKNAVGKALIVATDTAIKPLLNHGIRPNAFVTVDPSKPLLLFDKEEARSIPLICMENGNAQVIEKQKGKIFFSLTWEGMGRTLYERFGKEMPFLETGGSVANNAFSFLRDCGCDPIIFVGQDLAYTNKKSHADGTFQDKMQDVNTEESKYIEVEDIYGNTTYTTADFKHYLEWFEGKIEALENVKAIDATEGGAKIHGAELMTLRDAIATYCTEEFDSDKYFEEAPAVFNAEERKEVEEYLLDTPNILDKIKKKAKRGKQDYEDMIFRIKRDEWGKQLKSSLKKVGKLTTFLDEDETMQLMMPFLAKYDLAYKQRIRKMDVNTTEGLLEMLEGGKEYMDKIIEMVDALKEDFVAMTEKVKKMQEEDKE